MTPTRAARCSRTCLSLSLCPFIAPILLDLAQRLPYGVRDGVDLGIREFREARQRQDLARGLPRARALRLHRNRSPAPEERLARYRQGVVQRGADAELGERLGQRVALRRPDRVLVVDVEGRRALPGEGQRQPGGQGGIT